jgi:hypothetical protein
MSAKLFAQSVLSYFEPTDSQVVYRIAGLGSVRRRRWLRET